MRCGTNPTASENSVLREEVMDGGMIVHGFTALAISAVILPGTNLRA